MKITRFYTIGLSLILCVGCAHIKIPFVQKANVERAHLPSKEADKPNLQTAAFIDQGSIISAQKLQTSTNIAILPFKAGAGAVASQELDTVALTIIKGMIDAFEQDQTGKHAHFNVLMSDDSQNADLIVQGHVMDMEKPSRFKRWVLLKQSKILGVEGKVTDAKTGETVAIFVDQERLKSSDHDFKELGYLIGGNIGRFILSGLE